MEIRFLTTTATAVVLATAALQGCGDSTPDANGTTGTTASTGMGGGGAGGAGSGGEEDDAKEDPDYDAAFPQDRVPRLDITITRENWQAMLDDMTAQVGAFGEGGLGVPGGPGGEGGNAPGGPGGEGGSAPGGPGGAPPQELFDACAGLALGDACAAQFAGNELAGTCAEYSDGSLFCQPSGGLGGPGGPDGGSIDLIDDTPIYVECDVATEDREWHHVGIRFKGNSSLATSWSQGSFKLPLRLSFDKFEDDHPEIKDQRFYGFKNLSLANGTGDPSLVREKIATEIFARAGVPSPATAFYRVFIDHGEGPTYFGLYTGIELPSDKVFLKTQFDNDEGNVYKPDGAGATWATWDPDTLGKENNEDEADFSDAQALFDALHADRTDAAAWRAGLEAHLDVEGFLRWLAVNTVIEDWDQYGRMPHNYFLYADEDRDGQFRWIPWDHSFSFATSGGFGQGLSLSLDEVTDEWPLIRFLLDDPVYAEMYRDNLAQTVQVDYEPAAAEQRFREAHALIAPYVVGPEGEIEKHTFVESEASFNDALDELIAHASTRQEDVTTFLGQ
ncbi:CotH kinase family protein [Sorangium sp. So ce124]|uniref:CotH kinase family protein n=1 Tax=Sorangium sp. So ce124 TaxID=3133280 RepID=UPI003F603C7C